MTTVQTCTVKSILSKSKIPGVDYVLNPYVGCPHKCIYCYAEYMRKFSGHNEEWGEFLDVKQGAAPLHPAQLFRSRILLSSTTDPYNPYEAQYQSTRGLLKQLLYCQAQVSILTKSALVTRDIELLKQLPACEVAFSFSSADEHFRALAEPGSSSVEQKIQALKMLHEAGISTAVMAAPLLPGISDWKAIIACTRPYTKLYRFDSLNMRPAYQRRVISFVEKYYPHALDLYTQIYLKGDTSYWKNLEREIRAYCGQENIPVELYFSHSRPF